MTTAAKGPAPDATAKGPVPDATAADIVASLGRIEKSLDTLATIARFFTIGAAALLVFWLMWQATGPH